MILLRMGPRVVLSLPGLVLAAGGAYQLLRAPFDFSNDVPFLRRLPMWAVSIDCIIVSLPAIMLGLWLVRNVAFRTQYRFRVALFTMILPTLLILATAWMERRMAGRSESVFNYLGFGGGSLGAAGSIAITTLGVLVGFGSLAAAVYVYFNAIESDRPTRFDRQAGERDATGELIASMRRRNDA